MGSCAYERPQEWLYADNLLRCPKYLRYIRATYYTAYGGLVYLPSLEV